MKKLMAGNVVRMELPDRAELHSDANYRPAALCDGIYFEAFISSPETYADFSTDKVSRLMSCGSHGSIDCNATGKTYNEVLTELAKECIRMSEQMTKAAAAYQEHAWKLVETIAEPK